MARTAVNRVALSPLLYSLQFDPASTDKCQFDSFNYNPSGQPWTLCLSYYATHLPLGGFNDYNLYSQQDGTGTGRSWLYVDYTNNKLSTYLNGSTQNFSQTVSKFTWYRLCLTRNSSTGAVTLYVNGVSSGAVTPTVTNSTGVHVIGNNKSALNGGAGGLITNVAFYNYAFSATEALNEHLNPNAVSNANLMYSLMMTNGSGTTVSDNSGNARNATLTSVNWDSRVPSKARTAATRSAINMYRMPIELYDFGLTAYYDWHEGKIGTNGSSVLDSCSNGMDLSYRGGTPAANIWTAGEYSVNLESSSTDYFKQNAPRRINSGSTFGSLTAFCWFKKESNVVGCYIARWRPTGTGRSWQLRITGGSLLSFFASANGTTTAVSINSVAAYTDTNWNMLTVVNQQSTGNLKMYVNGQSISYNFVSGAGPATIFDSDIETWVGGLPDASNNPTVPFDGKIGICGFCKGTALSDAQVLRLYNLTRELGGY